MDSDMPVLKPRAVWMPALALASLLGAAGGCRGGGLAIPLPTGGGGSGGAGGTAVTADAGRVGTGGIPDAGTGGHDVAADAGLDSSDVAAGAGGSDAASDAGALEMGDGPEGGIPTAENGIKTASPGRSRS